MKEYKLQASFYKFQKHQTFETFFFVKKIPKQTYTLQNL